MNKDWLYLNAKQLVQGLKKGEISSRALLETYLSRIQDKNPALNAVVATDYENARKKADEADQATARGENWGPLHGLPITVKDTYEVPGMPCAAGAPIYAEHFPEKPAIAIEQLQKAGAIIIGKTNVPLFASDLQSFNKVYGTTHNPWNASCTPGGSSGGAAASLAAGFTALELGSDIGGSIRIPAHFCGVYGHKPTHGIISMRGHVPGPPGALSEPDLAVAGPMARNADDLQLMLDVIAGEMPLVQPGWQLKLPAPTQKKIEDFRVLMWIDDPLCPIDHQMTSLYQQLKSALHGAGVSVTMGAPLGMGLDDFYPLYMNLTGSVMGASQKKLERRIMGMAAPLIHRLGDYFDLPKRFEYFLEGADQSHVEWIRHNEKRNRMITNFQSIFEQYDVILMPPAATTALKHQHTPEMPYRKIYINGERRNYADMLMWISPATLLGLPSTSAPIGKTTTGMPVNIQIVGAPYRDKTTIKFAGLMAKVMGGFTVPPGYAVES